MVLERQMPMGFSENRGALLALPIPGMKELERVRQEDKLWPDFSVRGPGILMDLYGNDPHEFQFDPSSLALKDEKPKAKASVIAVMTPEIAPDDTVFAEKIAEAATRLSKNGSLYVIERRGKDDGVGWRSNFLDDVGIVERSVLKGNREFLTWRGRLPKEHVAREINLVELWEHSEVPWKRTALRSIAIGVRNRYAQSGYRLMNMDEIHKRLQATKNPHADINLLKEGLGVTVQSGCGCHWHVDLKGESSRVQWCGTEDCEGKAFPKGGKREQSISGEQKPVPVSIRTGDHEIEACCFDCGRQLRESVRVVWEKDGKTKLSIDWSCGEHGLLKHRKTTVFSGQVIKGK